jgi:hypothetical protein
VRNLYSSREFHGEINAEKSDEGHRALANGRPAHRDYPAVYVRVLTALGTVTMALNGILVWFIAIVVIGVGLAALIN